MTIGRSTCKECLQVGEVTIGRSTCKECLQVGEVTIDRSTRKLTGMEICYSK